MSHRRAIRQSFRRNILLTSIVSAAVAAGLGSARAVHAQAPPLPPLTTSGNQIRQNGQRYMLTGVGLADSLQPPTGGWNILAPYSPNDLANCLTYMKNVVNLVTNRSPMYGKNHGWGSRVVRLSLTPGWFDNDGTDPNSAYNQNPNGQHFDTNKLRAYIDNVVAPLAHYCQDKGVYLIITPGYVTDVTSTMLNSATPSQGVIWKFWDQMLNPTYDGSQGHYDQPYLRTNNVIYELYNEPVNNQISGTTDFSGFRPLIQPVVTRIRSGLGRQNLILIGSYIYDSQLGSIPSNQVSGTNIGYVAHIYPGTEFDKGHDSTTVTNTLAGQYEPTASQVPVVVTEYNWFDPNYYLNQQIGRANPYLATTDVFGQGLKNFVEYHQVAGATCWTWGEMVQNQNFDVNATSLDPNWQDFGQLNFDWIWQDTNGGQQILPTGALVRYQPGDVAPSSQLSGWQASYAIDNNAGTTWSSNGHSTGNATESIAYWWSANHSAFKSINTVSLVPRWWAAQNRALGFPTSFNIYYSNGSQWIFLRSVTGLNPTQSGWIDIPLPQTVNANGIQIVANGLGSDNAGGYYLQMSEVSGGLQ